MVELIMTRHSMKYNVIVTGQSFLDPVKNWILIILVILFLILFRQTQSQGIQNYYVLCDN